MALQPEWDSRIQMMGPYSKNKFFWATAFPEGNKWKNVSPSNLHTSWKAEVTWTSWQNLLTKQEIFGWTEFLPCCGLDIVAKQLRSWTLPPS